MRRFHVGWIALSSLVACKDEIDLDPVDDSPVVESRVRPKPIIGGTLTIASGLAVASDPDRDTIHVVDIQASRSELHTIALEPGEEPGRVVAGVEGIAHVVLRGSGNVGTIDLRAGTITRHRVCTDPRGIAFEAGNDTLYVACAGGSVLTLSAQTGEIVERVELEPDLRDVVIVDGKVMVSKFREATVLGLDGSRLVVPDRTDFDAFSGEATTRRPGAAWKTGVTEDGQVYVLHHLASTSPIPIEVEPEDIEGFDGGGGGGGAYGGSTPACDGGITTPVLTVFGNDGAVTTFPLRSKLTVDAVMTASGFKAVAQPGAEVGKSTLDVLSFSPQDHCGEDPTRDTGEGQVTAVALTETGDLVAQSREPARLTIEYNDGTRAFVALAGESRFDTGHEIFHRVTDSQLSCASCHPEGTDDGHVWTFIDIGPRRTQALDIRLEGTEPFHWDGDMADLDMIMGEVLTHRMGGKKQSSDRRASFRRWLFEQERPPTRAMDLDPGQVEEGAALFVAYGCETCHSGPGLGGATTERFGDLELQVPSLRRVSLRAPFMHDGRSADLDEAVRDMVEGSGRGEAPDEDVAAMVAYLRTL